MLGRNKRQDVTLGVGLCVVVVRFRQFSYSASRRITHGYNEKSARKTPPVEDVVFGDEEAVVGDSDVKGRKSIIGNYHWRCDGKYIYYQRNYSYRVN